MPTRVAVRLAESLLDCASFNEADIREHSLRPGREIVAACGSQR
jgi:hypothetical protein